MGQRLKESLILHAVLMVKSRVMKIHACGKLMTMCEMLELSSIDGSIGSYFGVTSKQVKKVRRDSLDIPRSRLFDIPPCVKHPK